VGAVGVDGEAKVGSGLPGLSSPDAPPPVCGVGALVGAGVALLMPPPEGVGVTGGLKVGVVAPASAGLDGATVAGSVVVGDEGPLGRLVTAAPFVK